jgi:hypothetical protein
VTLATDRRLAARHESGLLASFARKTPRGERTFVAVPVSGPPPAVGDLLIGVEAASGLAASIILVRRESYAGWSTIFRGHSLEEAYAEACRCAPESPRPLAALSAELARAIIA